MAPNNGEDMTAEQKLYWLNALQVMGDWSVHDDGDGRLFYYDRKTDASQWQVPESLASLETEFMMKLMLQNAVARSGAWSAHDAGNGTLYYFNYKTRESAWQRPSEWGQAEAEEREREQEAEAEASQVETQVETQKKEKKKHRKHKKKEKRDEVEQQQPKEEVKQKEPAVEEEEPLSAEELEAEKERQAREQKCIEQFRAMLRDKNIMPLCKWSVALPQIAGDPRFMGVPTMDERRAIFEHFVEHRRDDLKAEKKNNLKLAKQLFAQLLLEQFHLDSWAPNTSLSAFLSTLEGNLEPDRYKQIQDDALALLTVSTQEKMYAKAVAEYKSEALKRDGEELRLTKFFEKKLGEQNKLEPRWDSDDIQRLIREFYSSAASGSGDASPTLLSAQKQKQVFEDIVERTTRSRTTTQEETNVKQPDRSRSKRHSPVRGRGDSKEYVRRDPSTPRQSRHSHHERRRSRSYSRRRRCRSNSRSHSRGRERSHRSRRRSASSSRSRSHSRGERSSRRSSDHRRHHSSSRSRSRSRTRR